MPGGENPEFSYRVKCVIVESERLFGDVVVTRQTHERLHGVNSPSSHSSKRKNRFTNLRKTVIEGPDFMNLNTKSKHRRFHDGSIKTLLDKATNSEWKNPSTTVKEIIENNERSIKKVCRKNFNSVTIIINFVPNLMDESNVLFACTREEF